PSPFPHSYARPTSDYPSSVCMEICASVDSTKALPAPRKAMSHIQKIAPGPPIKIAVDTPTILPVPTRPASDTAIAWKLEIPSSDLPPLNIRRTMSTMYRTWNNLMRIEKYNPVTTRSMTSAALQTMSLKNVTTVSI